MKTDSPEPDHEELKALLAKSFHSEEAADVPPLPDDLRDRIRDQYGKVAATPVAATETESVFSKIFSLFSKPAFAGALGALALLVVVGTMLTSEGFRGKDKPAYTGASVALYEVSEPLASAIKEKLEPKAVKEISDLGKALSEKGRTIVIDGKAGQMKGYRSQDDSAPIEWELPQTADEIQLKVLQMMKELQGDE